MKKRISEHPEWTLENVEKVSVASKSLAKWVINAGKFSEINHMVEQQKLGLNELKKDLINAEYVLKATQEKFQAVNSRLMEVEAEFKNTSEQIAQL